MRAWLKKLGSNWNLLTQGVATIAASISAFIIPPPPGLMGVHPDAVFGLGRFVLAVLIGIVFLASIERSRKKDRWGWLALGLVALAMGLAGWLGYGREFVGRTARCHVQGRDTLFVLGTRLTEDAQAQAEEEPNLGPCERLEDFGWREERVWESRSIESSLQVLELLYLLALTSFGLSVVTVVQGIYCATTDNSKAQEAAS